MCSPVSVDHLTKNEVPLAIEADPISGSFDCHPERQRRVLSPHVLDASLRSELVNKYPGMASLRPNLKLY